MSTAACRMPSRSVAAAPEMPAAGVATASVPLGEYRSRRHQDGPQDPDRDKISFNHDCTLRARRGAMNS
jgi:hypothetical protein